jgi:hypothetical protein
MRLLAIFLFSGVALAQNSDLGVLLGVNTVQVGPQGSSTKVGVNLQLNYAFQFKETPRFRFYVEVPLLAGTQPFASVSTREYAVNGNILYLTPGLRVNLPLHSRVSLYGAAGGGLAVFSTQRALAGGDRVFAINTVIATAAGTAGGGLELRLSRLVSLRAEARDFIAAGSPGGGIGHKGVMYGVGAGFHW